MSEFINGGPFHHDLLHQGPHKGALQNDPSHKIPHPISPISQYPFQGILYQEHPQNSLPRGPFHQDPLPQSPISQDPFHHGTLYQGSRQDALQNGPFHQGPLPQSPVSQNPFHQGLLHQASFHHQDTLPQSPIPQNPFPLSPAPKSPHPHGPFRQSLLYQDALPCNPFHQGPLPQSPIQQGLFSHGSNLSNLDSQQYAADYAVKNAQRLLQRQATDYAGDDIQTLLYEVLQSGGLFEDIKFPANERSIGKKSSKTIEWRRPHEIVPNPDFFVDGVSRFDVTQGELGDCWLLAAVSNLTMHEGLFCQVVPPDQGFKRNYVGLFYFRFWRFGKWIEVAVDDRLPTVDGKLVFLRSTATTEFWSALFEKAYAKLYGSYEALTGGRPSVAMDDFTGGVSEIFEFHKNVPPNLFEIMLKGFERGSLMATSIEPNPHILEERCANGLIRGHSYAITCVAWCHLGTGSQRMIPLIRMRNPWGNEVEWNGPWSDQSREWRSVPLDEQHRLGVNFECDGEFWMNYEDFLQNFSSFEMTNINLETLTEKDLNNRVKHRWEVKSFEGSWVRGATAGGCSNNPATVSMNPKYCITLKEEDDGDNDQYCTMIVALLQKPRKVANSSGKPSFHCIGFSVHPIPPMGDFSGELNLPSLTNSKEIPGLPSFVNHRQVSHRLQLPPGSYCIMPSTFNAGEEGSFLLRIFTEKPNIIREKDVSIGFVGSKLEKELNTNPGGVSAPSPQESDERLRAVFDTLAGADQEIDYSELQNLLNKRFQDLIGSEGFSKHCCRSMVTMLDFDKSGKLGFTEFVHLWNIICIWKNAFESHDRDKSRFLDGIEFRDALLKAGFQISNKLFTALLILYGDKERKISFDDFMLCSIRLSKALKIFQAKDHSGAHSATFTKEEFLEHIMCI